MKQFLLDALGIICAYFVLILFAGEIIIISLAEFIPTLVKLAVIPILFFGLIRIFDIIAYDFIEED